MKSFTDGFPVWMIVSAPSGTGKTTLCDRLMADFSKIHYSVSCTTRQPRPNERNGINYHFMSSESFENRVNSDSFLEHAEVHGARYGTLKRSVLDYLTAGHDVLMDIDVQGAAKVREYLMRDDCDPLLRRSYVDVFIAPPSLDCLRERLVTRNSDCPEVIERRLAKAQYEMDHKSSYNYIIVNDDLECCYYQLQSIYAACHYRNAERPVPHGA